MKKYLKVIKKNRIYFISLFLLCSVFRFEFVVLGNDCIGQCISFNSYNCFLGIELPSDSFNKAVKGDVNEDDHTNANDALIVLKHSAKISLLNNQKIELADVDDNGQVNAQDALVILKIAAKIL